MKPILAHSKNVNGKAESLVEHLGAVSERAAEYAYALELVDSARAVGLLHDLGKYGERFQARLEGKETGIDHWSAGADACLRRYGKAWRAAAWGAALAIEGHHTGLSSPGDLHDLLKQLLEDKSRIGLRFSQNRHDHEELMAFFEGDGFKLPQVLSDRYEQQASAAFQVDVRMLFSTLVDADFIETEAHFKGSTPEMLGRDVAPELRPAELLAELKMEIARRTAASKAGTAMQNVRRDLQLACVKAAAWPSGLFTLGAPTGSGKTLAMLRFALEHALANPGQVRRIVMVVPYLNILDQTAQEYRTLVARAFPGEADRYLLEDHSLADTRQTDTWAEDRNRRRGILAENWHAPLVITTSVQFLESLHANRPGACRKLHRFAGAVILMDEVQTIPHKLAILTLATLSRLSERYGTSIVMSTATQPAFDKLDAAVKPFASAGWHPRDIAPKALGLFDHPSRTRVMWPLDPEERISWESAALELGESRRSQCLCIVNVKAHALRLMELLKDASGLLHLSTNMCPRHREVILREVSESLVAQQPCRLISTQCVEAGVDLDFPEVWRSIGPLEAIAQAAGRCNRHGARAKAGVVRVFRPPSGDESYPDEGYRQATAVTENLLREAGELGINLNDPEIYRRYYARLYKITNLEDKELLDPVRLKQFDIVAEKYRLIKGDTISVVVPWDAAAYEQLAAQARDRGINREWTRQARPFAVNLYRPARADAAWHHLEPVRLPHKDGDAPDWFLLREPNHYREDLGLILPKEMGTLYV